MRHWCPFTYDKPQAINTSLKRSYRFILVYFHFFICKSLISFLFFAKTQANAEIMVLSRSFVHHGIWNLVPFILGVNEDHALRCQQQSGNTCILNYYRIECGRRFDRNVGIWRRSKNYCWFVRIFKCYSFNSILVYRKNRSILT